MHHACAVGRQAEAVVAHGGVGVRDETRGTHTYSKNLNKFRPGKLWDVRYVVTNCGIQLAHAVAADPFRLLPCHANVEARGGPRPAVGVSASNIESAPRPSKSDFFGAVQSGFPEKADNQGPGGTWGLAFVHTGVDVDFQFVALVVYLWTLYAPGMRRGCVPHPRGSKWATHRRRTSLAKTRTVSRFHRSRSPSSWRGAITSG